MKKIIIVSILFISCCYLFYLGERKYIWYCKERFGMEFNVVRMQYNAPIIPRDWHIKSTDFKRTVWVNSSNTYGHSQKIVAHANCSIIGEYDVYKLKPQNGLLRWLQIEHSYTKDKNPVSYYYQIDDTSEKISEQYMDSLLRADNLKRDF